MKRYIGTIIAENRKRMGISQKELSERLEDFDIYVKSNAISSWEKNINNPTSLQLLAICEILEITDIYSEFIGENPADLFSQLNEKGKNKVMEYISLLLLSDDFRKKEEPKIIPFSRMMPISIYKTSAGVGNFLDDENFETVEIKEQIPDKASFGVYVSGDSMEPRIHDEQLIWVQKTEYLSSGEIGLFYLNGNTYVKKYRSTAKETCLISLNKKYDPIPVTATDDLKIFGRVLL